MNSLQLLTGKPMLCKRAPTTKLKIPQRKYEPKEDGTRGKGGKTGTQPLIINRHGVNYTSRLPEITEELKRLPDDTVLDFEIEAFGEDGKVDFTSCQRRCATKEPSEAFIQEIPVVAKTFDVLMLNGKDLTWLPYLTRKTILKDLLDSLGSKILLYVQHYDDGKELFSKEPEGVVAKLSNSTYTLGLRDDTWWKIKHAHDKVCDVVGYTSGEGKRSGWFGSLVLADPKTGKYVGKSGGGFSDDDSMAVARLLRNSPRMDAPFMLDDPYYPVKTKLQVEVTFLNITKNGVMRMPTLKRVLFP